MSPASPGDSPRSADGSDLGSFQIAASVLGPGTCEILCATFKSGVSISHSPAGLQSQMFQELIFPGQDPQAEDPDMELKVLASWGEFLIVITLPFLSSPPGDMGVNSPLLPIFLCFLLCTFSCRKYFLINSRFFSSLVSHK